MMAEILFIDRWKKHSGAWMEQPDDWVWTTPALQPQGFGLIWRSNVGLANLLWLALDLDHPPQSPYNMRYHPLCERLVAHGAKLELAGLPLFDQAAALTLAQFRNLCESAATGTYMQDLALELAQFANRRLAHAHA